MHNQARHLQITLWTDYPSSVNPFVHHSIINDPRDRHHSWIEALESSMFYERL